MFGNLHFESGSYYSNANFLLFYIGANAILAVSLAVCRAGVAVLKVPLYKVFIHELWYLIMSNENAKGESKKNSANTKNISNDL